MREKFLGMPRLDLRGKNHWNWRDDRDSLKKENRRNDPAYVAWAREVKVRDGFICRINNEDCSGSVVAHHILSWSKFPELRYKINNGITLCHAHHPRKRVDEQRLIPILKGLVEAKVQI